MTDTPHLGLPLIAASQSQKHVTHNQATVILDAIVMLSVVDSTHTAPPATASEGDRYKVASGATGAWAAWDLNIALYTSGQWVKLIPKKGWLCFDEATGALTVWTGSGWTDLAAAGGYLTIAGAGSVLGKQVRQARSRRTGDARQHVGEPGERVDVVELRRSDRRHCRGMISAALGNRRRAKTPCQVQNPRNAHSAALLAPVHANKRGVRYR